MIHVGDCLEVMRTLEANSVDAIVTDPPYGLEFMGKAWDTFSPGYKQPGFGKADGSKFRRERGTPSYTADGNPTCSNCGGDKYRNGPRKCACEAPNFGNPSGAQARAFQEFCEQWAHEALRVAKPGAYLVAFGGTRMFHRLASGIQDAGWEIRDTLMWVYGSGFPKSHNGEWGGTALKPAWEPIVLARKPLAGTVEANWREHGTGALNIDACRIGTEGEERPPITGRGGIPARNNESQARAPGVVAQPHELGRWPANLVHDGSEEVVACFPNAPGQQGDLTGREPSRPAKNTYGEYHGRREFKARREGEASAERRYTEAGGSNFALLPGMRREATSAARFFYCAKADRADRNDGCEGMPLGMPTAPNGAENAVGSKRGSNSKPRENIHPTVKPTDLMRWLCRLVTPTGGLVLDPFCGSGSTGRGAIAEGFRFVGIELDPDYARIAEARIRAVQPGLPLGTAA